MNPVVKVQLHPESIVPVIINYNEIQQGLDEDLAGRAIKKRKTKAKPVYDEYDPNDPFINDDDIDTSLADKLGAERPSNDIYNYFIYSGQITSEVLKHGIKSNIDKYLESATTAKTTHRSQKPSDTIITSYIDRLTMPQKDIYRKYIQTLMNMDKKFVFNPAFHDLFASLVNILISIPSSKIEYPTFLWILANNDKDYKDHIETTLIAYLESATKEWENGLQKLWDVLITNGEQKLAAYHAKYPGTTLTSQLKARIWNFDLQKMCYDIIRIKILHFGAIDILQKQTLTRILYKPNAMKYLLSKWNHDVPEVELKQKQVSKFYNTFLDKDPFWGKLSQKEKEMTTQPKQDSIDLSLPLEHSLVSETDVPLNPSTSPDDPVNLKYASHPSATSKIPFELNSESSSNI